METHKQQNIALTALLAATITLSACSPSSDVADAKPINPEIRPVPELVLQPVDQVSSVLETNPTFVGMSPYEKSRVLDYINIDNPYLSDNVGILGINTDRFTDMNVAENGAFVNGSGSIIKLDDGNYGLLTAGHVLYYQYDKEFYVDQDVIVAIPGVGLVSVKGERVAQYGFGVDSVAIVPFRNAQLNQLLREREESGSAIYGKYSNSFGEFETMVQNQDLMYYYDPISKSYVPIKVVDYDFDQGLLGFRILDDQEVNRYQSAFDRLDITLSTDPYVCAASSGSNLKVFSTGDNGQVMITTLGALYSRTGVQFDTTMVVAGVPLNCTNINPGTGGTIDFSVEQPQ